MIDLNEAEDRTPFDAAHPSLTLTADDGEQIEIPAERLPRLLGWTVLLQPWQAPKKTAGGLFLPDVVADANEYMAYVFKVVSLGPLAFTHPRLRGGARRGTRVVTPDHESDKIEHWREDEWSEFAKNVAPPKPGDWCIVRKFSGIRLEINGVSLKLCNDDDILAVIDSPAGWKAYI